MPTQLPPARAAVVRTRDNQLLQMLFPILPVLALLTLVISAAEFYSSKPGRALSEVEATIRLAAR